MSINIGMITSSNQINIKTLNLNGKTISSKLVDSIGLKEEKLSLLLFQDSEELNSLKATFDQESKFYPIITTNSLKIEGHDFEAMSFEDLYNVYVKVSGRWILSNNIKTIEQLCPTVNYLKGMWVKDRNSFFEELWFLLKTNLGTTELSIVFNDLKEPTEAQKEKGEKAKLIQSCVKGNKLPNLVAGKEAESILMKEYEKEFTDIFTITEYSQEKNQLVACAKIGLSPILMMANVAPLNQLQQSILLSIFTGLQEES